MLTLLVLLVAQATAPTPTPNPLEYSDLGMHFTAPAGFFLEGQRKIKASALQDDPTPIAMWVMPGDHPRRIMIQMEAWNGPLGGFVDTYEQQMRSQVQNALFSHKEQTTLKNGMPAVYVEMSIGEGFNQQRAYMYLWVDRVRGASVTVMAPIGELDERSAKALLSDVSAVAYPIDREEP